jgi:integrase
MAHTIRERGGRWHVAMLPDDTPPVEKLITRNGRAKARDTVDNATLGEIMLRYGREVSAIKQGAQAEVGRANMIARSSVGDIRIKDLTPSDLVLYRDKRLATVSNSTVRNEFSIIRRALEIASREWGYAIPVNPASLVTLPRPGPARDRRLRNGEYEKLEDQLRDNRLVWAFVRFAIHTAMRRGEILGLMWRHVNIPQRTAHLPMTKSGNPRTVPLTDDALQVLTELKGSGERVFPLDPNSLRYAWDEACRKAGIADLRMHDLRLEGVSRLFEMDLTVPEVALISGHKTVSSLFRHAALMPIELAGRLKGRKRRS